MSNENNVEEALSEEEINELLNADADEEEAEEDKKKKRLIIILLIILFLLILLLSTWLFGYIRQLKNAANKGNQQVDTGIKQTLDQVPYSGSFIVKEDGDTDISIMDEERTEFPLYSDCTFTDGSYIELVNLEQNTVFINYVVYYNDASVYESGNISPGYAVQFKGKEIFKEPGEYPVILYAYTYDINDPSVACLPLPFELTITIK